MYVYIETERFLWTVGFYDPTGKFHSDSDYPHVEEAAARVNYLNGGKGEERPRYQTQYSPNERNDCPF